MLNRPAIQRGVTLVEIVIGVAIGSALLTMGVVSFGDWVQNAQIRAEAESIQGGLQLARATAVQRNSQVLFQLTTSTGDDCVVSVGGTNWVISASDPTGLCATPGGVVPPDIIQVGSSSGGSANANVAADQAAFAFTGLGRLNPAPAGTVNIDIFNPVGGACVSAGGNMRCLRVWVSVGGQIGMCDPALANASDPGACPQ